ncbi:MAG: hypothetical protein GXO77_15615 [Calditrichaeota bacterium]|nr:hypothetical protein [Calditrichota bacterium]
MPELVQINIPFIIILLSAVLAFVIARFFYRNTNPPIRPAWKWVLIILRAAVLFSIFILFFAPALRLIFYQQKAEKVAVFIDNSNSMNVEEARGKRWDQVVETVRRLESALKDQNPQWFSFNSQVEPLSVADSLKPSRGGTNFRAVLNKIRKSKFDKAVIISDGVVTEGGYPLGEEENIRTKLVTVPIGQARNQSDVFIRDVEYKPVAYQNQKQEITVVLGSVNLSKKENVLIRLNSGKKVVADKPLSLSPGDGSYRVSLDYRPKTRGLREFRVSIGGLKDDANPYNNEYRFVQEVLKSRITVALMSPAPDYDEKFLKIVLEKNPKFRVYPFVEDNRGRFLQKSDLRQSDSADIWIFVDYPGDRTSGVIIGRLREAWQKNRPSLLLFSGKRLNWKRLKNIVPSVPVSPMNQLKKQKQLTVQPVISEKSGSFINLFPDEALNQRFWNRIPPILNYTHKFKFDSKPLLLLSSTYQGESVPVVSLFEKAAFKFALFNGQNFWQWRFLMQSDEEIFPGYRIFFEKILNWLANKAQFKPVLLTINKKAGHIGEPFQLNIRLFDSRFQPAENGSVLLTVKTGGQSFSLSAEKTEEGTFGARFVPPTDGKFKIVARGYQQDRLLGSDSLRVAVVPVGKEFIHLSPDTLFLQRLARASGGNMLRPAELDRIKEILPVKKQIVTKEKTIELWYKLFILIFILTLITLEWSLRKKLNLV